VKQKLCFLTMVKIYQIIYLAILVGYYTETEEGDNPE